MLQLQASLTTQHQQLATQPLESATPESVQSGQKVSSHAQGLQVAEALRPSEKGAQTGLGEDSDGPGPGLGGQSGGRELRRPKGGKCAPQGDGIGPSVAMLNGRGGGVGAAGGGSGGGECRLECVVRGW